MTVSRWPSSSRRREPVPSMRAMKSSALPAVEQGTRSIRAWGGRSAAQTATASSAPSMSPEGEDTAASWASTNLMVGDRETARGRLAGSSRAQRLEPVVEGVGHPHGVRLGRGRSRAGELLVDRLAPQVDPALEVAGPEADLLVQLVVGAEGAAPIGLRPQQHGLPERGDAGD